MGSSDRNCFEVVIIGSGFGGSVMAYRPARAGLKVCVLERGKAYAPGEFPRSPRAVADNVWDRSRGLKGLFDFWSFDSMEAVVASGLGGGSLIYANVMLRMPDEWFVIDEPNGSTRPWPVGPRQLDRHYAAVEAMLGATPYPYAASTPKTKAFLRATDAVGLERVKPLNLAVAFTADGNTRPGLPLHRKNLHHAPRSKRHTRIPARASRAAVIPPPYPDPTTTASYSGWRRASGIDIRGSPPTAASLGGLAAEVNAATRSRDRDATAV